MTDVIIIGGGLAGLAAANYLHQKGQSIQLLEASDHGISDFADHIDTVMRFLNLA